MSLLKFFIDMLSPDKKEERINLKPKLKAHRITKDVWFYQNKRSLDFVVWQKGRDGNKTCCQFRLFLKQLGI